MQSICDNNKLISDFGVFMWAIPENPASHKYVEENGCSIALSKCA